MKLTIKTADDLADDAALRAAMTARKDALTYLAETDWMVIRALEGGAALPDDIRKARAAARARVTA